MTSFVDIHHHLIYGLDYGAQTFEDTKAMLKTTHKNGVKTIAATTHVMLGIERFDLMDYRGRLATAQKWSNEQALGIHIWSGSGILYTAST